jgi:hypothetical protein
MIAQRVMQLVLAAVLLFAGWVHAAPLTGKSLSGTNSDGTFSPGTTAAVGAGVEFTADYFSTPFFSIDVDEDGLVTVTDVLSGALIHNNGQLLSFFDVFANIDPIIGFDLTSTSGVTDISQSDLAFSADSFSMEVGSGTVWSTGDFFTAQLRFEQVPEPGSALLVALALAGIGLVRHRKAA